MTETLQSYLFKCGYGDEDADEIAHQYHESGIESAVKRFEYANDYEHDYTGELRYYIREWERCYPKLSSVTLKRLD